MSKMSKMSLLAAVLLATSAAMAGNAVVKCVDPQGHVTLTDQPCDTGSSTERVDSGSYVPASMGSSSMGSSSGGATGSGGGDADAPAVAERPAAQRHVLPAAELRRPAWRAPAPAHAAPLSRDVATLKEARRAQLLLDGPRTSLAGLP